MSPVIDKKDLVFFSSFGLVIAIFMKVFEQVELPIQMERGFLESLFFDHIPFDSIAMLLLSMTVLFLVSIAIGASSKKTEARKASFIHLSNRVSQLCSPAFFITLGLAIGVLIIGGVTSDYSYYLNAATFMVFSAMLLFMSYLSNILIYCFDKAHEKLPQSIAILGVGILLFTILINAYLNIAPMKVEISVSISDYELLEKKAKKKGVSINNYIESLLNYNLHTN